MYIVAMVIIGHSHCDRHHDTAHGGSEIVKLLLSWTLFMLRAQIYIDNETKMDAY